MTTVNLELLRRKRALRPREVEILYGLDTSTLQLYRAEGRGPAFVQISPRVIRYRVQDIDNWLATLRVSTMDDPAPSRLQAAGG